MEGLCAPQEDASLAPADRNLCRLHAIGDDANVRSAEVQN